MKKVGLSFLFSILLLGLFATAALANDGTEQDLIGGYNEEMEFVDVTPTNPNANNTAPAGIDDRSGDSFSEVIKSTGMIDNEGNLKDQKTHGSYQNNTNSCASCHQTHTAQARSLLFADSTYQTCAACHDGTLGFYNVFETGEDYFASETTAGTFGGTQAGNMSVHLATGSVAIKAAPGGNPDGTGSWTDDFTCASCHSPHGTYSGRLLHYNPNNMGNTAPDAGGIKAADVPVVAFADKGGAGSGWQMVIGTKAQHNIDDAKIAGDAVVGMLYLNGTKNSNPWLYGYGARGSGTRSHAYYSSLYRVDSPDVDGSGRPLSAHVVNYGTAGVYFNFSKGYVYSTTEDGKTALNATIGNEANIGRAYVVDLKLEPVEGAPSDVVTKHDVSHLWSGGDGVAAGKWCLSCHTDYEASRGVGVNDGVSFWDENKEIFGHSTNSASYTCLRCHYAHGTDVTVMLDAQSNTLGDLEIKFDDDEKAHDYLMDQNPSSALKKFTNMAGCFACHNSSRAETFKNRTADEDIPSGFISDPSTRSWTN